MQTAVQIKSDCPGMLGADLPRRRRQPNIGSAGIPILGSTSPSANRVYATRGRLTIVATGRQDHWMLAEESSKKIRACTLLSLALAALPAGVRSQGKEIGEASVRPTQETKRRFEAFAGDWDTSEKRERTQFFPNGGDRQGRSHVRLAAGGAVLVMEGHSDGSFGPLSYIIVIWWDKDANIYRYFTCFKDAGSGCEVRGQARWDDDRFVNDYEEVVDGHKMKFRDTFQDITPNSHTLVFAWVKDDGSTQPVIISKALRRPSAPTTGIDLELR